MIRLIPAGSVMATVLLLDGDFTDIRTEADLVITAGFSDLELSTSSVLAVARLANALDDGGTLPDVIIIDLNLGRKAALKYCGSFTKINP